MSRSMEASQKVKNVTVKTLDSTMSKRKHWEDPKSAKNISSKCADINADMLSALGVSKPILNYVIFCHQEDSNWPLDVGSKVKERFDEIFNSVKYKNCLKMVKDVRKKEMDEAKLEKNNALHYKSDKEYADQKRSEMRKKQKEATKLEQSVERIGEELKPLREKLLQVQEEEKGFSENQRLLAEAETSLGHCKKERQSLERQMGEVLGEEITDEEIKSRSEGVDKETRSKERRLEELEDERRDHEEDMKKVETSSQKQAAKIGQAITEKERNSAQMTERDRLVQKASSELGIGDEQGDMLAAIKAESQKLHREMKTLMAEQKTKEDKLEVELDELKARKTGLEERKKRDQGDLVNAKKEIAQLKRQLNELAGASDQLEKIKKDWTEGEKKLKAARGKHDLDALQEEIAREKETVAELDEKERQLRGEARGMEDKAAVMQKIEHLVEDIDVKKKKMQKILNKRREVFAQLFGKVPQPKSLREEFQKKQETTEEKMKELDGQKKKKEIAIDAKASNKVEVKREKDKKSSRWLELKNKCSDVFDIDDDIEQEIEETKQSLETGRRELQIKEAGKFVYKDQIDMLRKKDSPACPTCNRDFKKKSEVEELIQDLEAQIKGIPAKVKSLEAKVTKHSGRLDALQRVRPDIQALKQLGEEVKEAEKKMDLLDKDVKKLRDGLEDEEAEHTDVEVAVTELREVAEDVQIVDGLRRELEQLEEKLEDLRLEAGGDVGERSLEVVRREEAEVCTQLRCARSNLDTAQETVTTQTTLINRLEASQNSLTNKKLEIEGQQQKQAATEAKKEELEAKVGQCNLQVKQCEEQLGPVREELEEGERRRREMKRGGEEASRKNQERERNLERVRVDLDRLDADLKKYQDDGKDEELDRLQKEKDNLEKKMSEMRKQRVQIEHQASELKVEVSNQESRKRLYEDNLKLRGYKDQEQRHARAVRLQQSALEERDWGRVERKKTELNRQWNELNAEKNAMGGQQAEVERSIREMERELNSSKLKDAASRFKAMNVSMNLRNKVASDLNKYYIALDYAIMKYHREKMKVVNKIIRELWLQVYRGNDIDYIEIKTDDDGNVQAGADKRKTYSYRVVMVKNDTELDMRGRCSAGQKVLASLIIRLALAETFSTNCGIIALDEPTTNLDKENVDSLANALADIANKRAEQRNFQLVVITHDEEFIESLSRLTSTLRILGFESFLCSGVTSFSIIRG